jgi:hypothetical protein
MKVRVMMTNKINKTKITPVEVYKDPSAKPGAAATPVPTHAICHSSILRNQGKVITYKTTI